jgi:hypothetical protein
MHELHSTRARHAQTVEQISRGYEELRSSEKEGYKRVVVQLKTKAQSTVQQLQQQVAALRQEKEAALKEMEERYSIRRAHSTERIETVTAWR